MEDVHRDHSVVLVLLRWVSGGVERPLFAVKEKEKDKPHPSPSLSFSPPSSVTLLFHFDPSIKASSFRSRSPEVSLNLLISRDEVRESNVSSSILFFMNIPLTSTLYLTPISTGVSCTGSIVLVVPLLLLWNVICFPFCSCFVRFLSTSSIRFSFVLSFLSFLRSTHDKDCSGT